MLSQKKAATVARPLNNRMPLSDTSFDAGITSGVVNGSSPVQTPVRHFLSHHPALLAGTSAKSGPSSVSKVVGLLSYHPALIDGASVQTLTLISYFTLNVATGIAVADAIFI